MCLDQVNLSRYATCDEREELPVIANFSNQVLPCFAEDARLRGNMPVCLLSCLIPLAIRPVNKILSKYNW